MYRNYDGGKSTFGDTSVSTSAPDSDNVAAFGAQRSADNALTVMVVCKTLTGNTPVQVNTTGFSGHGTAHGQGQGTRLSAEPDNGLTVRR